MTEELHLAPHSLLSNFADDNDIHDDVLQSIFSFLDAASLINVGQTSKRFRCLSSHDLVWRYSCPRYKNRRKERYIHHKKRLKVGKRQSLYLELGSTVNNKFQTYIILTQGVVLPISVVMGLMYISVAVPVLLDGFIAQSATNFWYASIPALVLILVPFAIAVITLMHSACVFYPALNIILKKIPSIDNSQILSCFVVIGWVLWLPLLIVGVLILLLISPIHATATYAFRLSFLPVHLFAVLYLWMSVPVFFCARNINNFDRSYTVAYGVGILINSFVAIQAGLISTKLDQVLLTSWAIVFIPMWLIFAIMLLLWLVVLPFIRNSANFLYVLMLLIFVAALSVPYTIWLILFALRLDLVVSFNFVFVFTPLYVGIVLGILGVLVFLFYC
jgi:hypothetical protein